MSSEWVSYEFRGCPMNCCYEFSWGPLCHPEWVSYELLRSAWVSYDSAWVSYEFYEFSWTSYEFCYRP